MAGRTFAIGDIHGELGHLAAILVRLPPLDPADTILFLGDYIDRGPDSRDVIEFLREFPFHTPARVICLRGNHEDAWLRVIEEGWDEFVMPPANGCLPTVRSFLKDSPPAENQDAYSFEMLALTTGSFFPPEIVAWMKALPYWHEDEHGIYVHAGLPPFNGRFAHPSEAANPAVLIWSRKDSFIREYDGKHVVFGHTPVSFLPQDLSDFTPDDPTDLWAGPHSTGIDTGCGSGGFLTALELPAMTVYESRS
ncbi:MAG: metallophosphoesterase family protein [Nibricoccus sp.]